jgi:hypothetical protein
MTPASAGYNANPEPVNYSLHYFSVLFLTQFSFLFAAAPQ